MIIPDINILVHAYNSDSARHEVARRWLEDTSSGSATVGLPWGSDVSARRDPPRAPVARNAGRHDRHAGDRHAEILSEALEGLGTAGNLTTDAHLTALAIEYRAQLASTDADFSRFSGLRWFNPLAG